MDEELKDYDLTCWYINLRRVAEIVGAGALGRVETLVRERSSFAEMGPLTPPLHALLHAAFKDAIVGWIQQKGTPSLGQLIVADKLKEGSFFTFFGDVYSKGLSSYPFRSTPKKPLPLPYLHAKIDYGGAYVLRIPFHPEHLTSDSAWNELSRRTKVFVLGAVKTISRNDIEVIPYVIAYPYPSLGEGTRIGNRWYQSLEVFVDGIDSFERVRKLRRPSAKNVDLLKDIPEDAVKKAFAEILDEPAVPKDWGGERSDLFSSRVVLDGKRISTAFIFKGPSKFKPMVPADLGKNGDQIERLFTEPAELFVLQHCHVVEKSVRNTMRAFASQLHAPRLYCVIDGLDTLRVLRAYRKCGF